MKIKMIEDLTKTELLSRVDALEPLCNFENLGIPSEREYFMRAQWHRLRNLLPEWRSGEVPCD